MSLDAIFSEEFEEYRKLEAEKCVQVIRELITGHRDSAFFQGAMWMLKAIINLPVDAAKSKEAKERAEFLRESMMKYLEAKMMRSFLDEQ